ncbi:sulfotransferase family protein [Mycobacterium sp. E2497]|uniref:sulfotransferase family protein n=1 Tax=Mycobacterium sp. E2497 TaxID=1834135 RepID=UPI0012EA5EBA|nr:sulfotransferase [Mycobacterium sp. E2497]
MAPPVALFVLGMFRSGTSALTRVLSLCGGTLPASLVGARVGNPLGHWEPRAANYLNESILHRHGSSVFDPSLRLQEEDAFTAEENAACIAEIRGFLTTLPVAPLVVIKDPKITVLPDQWFEAARLAGFNIAVAITVRHPQEVMSSVAALNKTSPELSGALWLKYTLMAERRTRDLPRVFVDYANLLDDWRREVERVSAALAIDLTTRDEDAIDAFLAPDLRHTRHCGPVTDVFGTDWMPATYEALRAAARDEPLDEPALDRVFDAYRTSEHAFRVAFEDFRDHHNGVLFRPSIRKLVNEVVAKTHLEGVLARPSVSKLAHEIRRW